MLGQTYLRNVDVMPGLFLQSVSIEFITVCIKAEKTG
jgi:hypothetical protein